MVTDPTSGRFAGDLIQAGEELFSCFLHPYPGLSAFISRQHTNNLPVLLNIESPEPEVLQLPWELLFSTAEGDTHPFLAVNPWFQVIKTLPDQAAALPPLSAPPLRILLMSLLPQNTSLVLNYEREEKIILDAVADLKRQGLLEIDIAHSGTTSELEKRLTEKPYQVVYISKHGSYDERTNRASLCFEDSTGLMEPVDAGKLAEILSGNKSLRLLFLSNCQSARGSQGLAYSLAAGGIPLVIGMMNSIQDRTATMLVREFFTELTLKKDTAQALQGARKGYYEKQRLFQWAITTVFCRSTDTQLVDWKLAPAIVKPVSRLKVLYGKISRTVDDFVDRRKPLREFSRLLRARKLPALCITGAGGIGKSTLSTRLADRFYEAGYKIVPLAGVLTPDSFIQQTIRALVLHKEEEHVHFLNRLTDYHDRIDYILANVMGNSEILYLLDNFEDNLDQVQGFREFKNSYWQETFTYILEQLPHTRSVILITCRYTVPRVSGKLLTQKPLEELDLNEVRKLILFNETLSLLTPESYMDIYQTIGGNPLPSRSWVNCWNIRLIAGKR